jgi:uncharacterized surface protein with fasciclin (FAS1) repeats
MALTLPLALALAMAIAPPVPHAAPDGSMGCANVPRTMPDRPVAEAISRVPNLSTLSDGIGATGLTAELNGAPQVTVFAPVNEAFRKLSGPITFDPQVLKYHVVPERLASDRLVGSHRTWQGGELSVAGGGAHFRVNTTAGLICTRIEAANGNIYLIDAVLAPR